VPIIEAEQRVLAVASGQYGLITRAQARSLGLTESRIKYRLVSRRWERVHYGVYRVAGSPPLARQRALAACLWLGDGAAVSHVTAARLLRLDGIPKQVQLHVSMPLERRRSSLRPRSFLLHRARRFEATDRSVVDGIPCTSAARTLLDIAGIVPDATLEIAFESARRLGLTSVSQLLARYGEVGGRGRKGSAKVRRLLERQRVGDRPLDSPLEVKLWRLLQRSGLVLPDRQVPLASRSGEQYRVDFLWRELAWCSSATGSRRTRATFVGSGTVAASPTSSCSVSGCSTSRGTTSSSARRTRSSGSRSPASTDDCQLVVVP
jgi:hypothetical protein